MKTFCLRAACSLLCSTLLFAQQGVPGPTDAAARPSANVLQERAIPLRFLGSQLTGDSTWMRELSAALTPNVGSIEYSPDTKTLTAKDRVEALDALAAKVATLDIEPAQVQVDIRVVRITDPQVCVRALEGTGQTCAGGVAILDARQATAALRVLRQEHVDILQAPQIVALSDQTAEIFVGKKRSVRLLPDGGAAAPIDGDSIELMFTPRVDRQTERVALDLQVRSQFTSPNAARVAQPLVLNTGETAVLQRNAVPGVGALIFVTPTVIRQAPASRLTR